MATTGLPGLLDAALRRDPARPLLTFYDDAGGERAELSVTTFGTWVAKTANLLRDDLAVEAGGTLALDLPCHWQAAVWLQSAWALGLHVVPAGADRSVDVHVTTYEPTGPLPPGAGEVVALGLGPLALPRRDAGPPAGTTLDYDREVAGHGDRFTPSWPVDPDAPALTTGEGTWTGSELAAGAAAQRVPGRALLLTEPLTTLTAVLAGLLVPLATDVTAVLCRHPDNLRLPSRVEQEGVVLGVTSDTSGPPAWEPDPVRAHRNLT